MTEPVSKSNVDDEQETVEIPVEQYERLFDARSQLVGEGWMDVARLDDETVRARPVERQEGRREGELITSDAWLIEDVNGETYTVSEKTFEEKYDSLVTEQFVMDLSVDPIETEEGEPDIGGTEIIVEMTAHIDLPHHVVDHLSIDRVYFEGEVLDGLPIEVLEDHEKINRAETEDDEQHDE